MIDDAPLASEARAFGLESEVAMPCVIAIDVAEVTNNCFVAFPFAAANEGEHPITAVVQDAVVRTSRDVFWIDKQSVGKDIVPTIRAGISQAAMVIAVCSPGADHRTNPNVMYELGLADALAKPTLVITDDPEALPFDIRSRGAFVYQKADLETRQSCEALTNRLVVHMQMIMKRVSRQLPVILGDVAGTHALGATNSLVLLPQFWAYARSVFEYAIDIYNAIEGVMPWLDRLNVDARGLYRGRDEALATFFQDWRDYRKLHLNRIRTTLSESRSEGVRRHLEVLRGAAGTADGIVVKCEADFRLLCSSITDHLGRFEPTAAGVEEVERGAGTSATLFSKTDPLQSTAENLMNTANALIRNLVQRICDSFAEGYA